MGFCISENAENWSRTSITISKKYYPIKQYHKNCFFLDYLNLILILLRLPIEAPNNNIFKPFLFASLYIFVCVLQQFFLISLAIVRRRGWHFYGSSHSCTDASNRLSLNIDQSPMGRALCSSEGRVWIECDIIHFICDYCDMIIYLFH